MGGGSKEVDERGGGEREREIGMTSFITYVVSSCTHIALLSPCGC